MKSSTLLACPYCKGRFGASEIGAEEVKGSDLILKQAVYFCPRCKTILGIAGK